MARAIEGVAMLALRNWGSLFPGSIVCGYTARPIDEKIGVVGKPQHSSFRKTKKIRSVQPICEKTIGDIDSTTIISY